jgi:hypothetical protein
MNSFLDYENNIFVFLPQIILLIIFSVITYIGITFTIDKKTRDLVKLIIGEIKNGTN